MQQKLSVITICYNDLKGLQVTIPSVLSQTIKDFQWLIIDGGSTDGSKEYIERVASDIKRLNGSEDNQSKINIIWKSEPDTGIYNAMNKGVSLAKGEYCLFMNAGDVFCSSKSLERAFKKSWNADIICCDEFVMSSKKNWDYIQAPRKITFHRILKGYIPHQSTFIRRELLISHPYNEDYRIVADWAFWWETLIANNYTYQHLPFPLSAFDCTGVSSTNHDKNYAERLRFLSHYIPEHNVLKRITNECLIGSTIEGDFLFNSERSILKSLFFFIRSIYVHIVGPIHKIYVNLRWRE